MNAPLKTKTGLTDWCWLEETYIGSFSHRPLERPSGNWRKGKDWRTISELWESPEAPNVVTLVKVWAGMLRVLWALHERPGEPGQPGTGARLLLQTDPALWHVEPAHGSWDGPDLPIRRWGLLGWNKKTAKGLDKLPGKLVYLAGDEPLYERDRPLAGLGAVDRLAAPEVADGGIADEAADVYLAAAHVLALSTRGPLQVTCDDVPIVLEALALARPDIGPGLSALLAECLAPEPADRPSTPRRAYERLDRVVAVDLEAARRSLKTRHVLAHAERSIEGRRRMAGVSPGGTGGDPGPDNWGGTEPKENQDRAIRLDLDRSVVALGVLDGVSTADVGSGGDAADLVADRLRGGLRVALEQAWADGPAKTLAQTLGRLAQAASQAIKAANEALIDRMLEEHAGSLVPGIHTPTTTCTLVLARGDLVVITWTGDSIAFLVRGDSAATLTAPSNAGNLAMFRGGSVNAYLDHPSPRRLVAPLGRFEVLSSAEIEQSEKPPLSQVGLRLEPGDFLLLTSDGVSEHLADDLWARARTLVRLVAASSSDPDIGLSTDPIAHALVGRSERRDGEDDMTVVAAAWGVASPSRRR